MAQVSEKHLHYRDYLIKRIRQQADIIESLSDYSTVTSLIALGQLDFLQKELYQLDMQLNEQKGDRT